MFKINLSFWIRNEMKAWILDDKVVSFPRNGQGLKSRQETFYEIASQSMFSVCLFLFVFFICLSSSLLMCLMCLFLCLFYLSECLFNSLNLNICLIVCISVSLCVSNVYICLCFYFSLYLFLNVFQMSICMFICLTCLYIHLLICLICLYVYLCFLLSCISVLMCFICLSVCFCILLFSVSVLKCVSFVCLFHRIISFFSFWQVFVSCANFLIHLHQISTHLPIVEYKIPF